MFICVCICVSIFTLCIYKCICLYAYRNDAYLYIAVYRSAMCNNLHTYTLVDILYIFHTGMCSKLFVFVFRYLALYLYANFLLDVCIYIYVNSGEPSAACDLLCIALERPKAFSSEVM